MKAKISIMSAIIVSVALIITGCAPSCPEIGGQAPDFTLNTVDGESVTLSDFRGNPVMVNFWSTRCVPCVMEMPLIQAVYDERSNQGLVVLAINMGDSATTAKEFVTSRGLTFPVLLDPRMTVFQKYCLPQAIPITLFINAEGIYKAGKAGAFQSLDQIESLLDAL